MKGTFTIREFNEITDFGRKVKTVADFEFVARQRFSVSSTTLLFKLAIKHKCWIAKNCIEIYKYHRVGRLIRSRT